MEVRVRLSIEVERAELAALPEGRLEELGKAVRYAKFWKFRRGCECVEAYADFHLAGFLNPPPRIFTYNHPENRGGGCGAEKRPLWSPRDSWERGSRGP